jgi:hypothetical protein
MYVRLEVIAAETICITPLKTSLRIAGPCDMILIEAFLIRKQIATDCIGFSGVCCRYVNETSGPINSAEFLDHLSKCYIPRNDSSPISLVS